VLQGRTKDSCIYDLIEMRNHYKEFNGWSLRYVATSKATLCGQNKKEEVAYNVNGVGMSELEPYNRTSEAPIGWSLGLPQSKSCVSML
jgi:hypothetical protein